MHDPAKRLFLLDAMALIYRAYFALNKNPRINSKGLNTSATLGFANTLLDLLKNERPTHIGVVFDSAAPTMRHEEYKEYKAHREAMPEDISLSLPYIIELIRGFRIPLLIRDGYEADDIIGTLARRAEAEGFTTYMVTPDKDFGQLVTEKTLIYKPGRAGEPATIMGIKEVCAKFGIERPEQVIDILGLWGDASDNIPGIPGIGEKRSQELIAAYGNVEGVIAHAGELKGKIRENVLQFAEQGMQSKMLATIITDAPVPFEPEELLLSPPDLEALSTLFNELEFRTYARRMQDYLSGSQLVTNDIAAPVASQPAVSSPQPQADLFSSAGISNPPTRRTIHDTPHRYHSVTAPEDLQNLLSLLGNSRRFCFDTETTGLDPQTAVLVGMSFAITSGEAWYVPLPEAREDCLEVLNLFRHIFGNVQIAKIGQNLKFDLAILAEYGIEVGGALLDTMIAHYLLEPDLRHNMDYLAEEYLGYSPISIESLIGKKGARQGNMRDVPLEVIAEYAGEDADITLQLWEVFEPRLEETGTRKLFDDIEMPLVNVLTSMEMEGVKLDTTVLASFSEELGTAIVKVEKDIYDLSETQFNINSPKQLGQVLFEKLKIGGTPQMTRTKQYSTSEDVLSKLADKHPVIDKVLEYRSLTKLKSTYVDALPALISPRTGRIHTTYNQAVASTGRLSSNNPNLQNIPVRTTLGREIRKAFVARDEDHILLAADYSQIELRLIAHLSGDAGMIQAFAQGQDIHTTTAARIFGVEASAVDRDMRSKAKEVNFGLAYGMSAFGLSERLRISRKEANEIVTEYFRQYPGIREYMDAQVRFARAHGYVETIMKRRRYLRDIRSSNAVVRGLAERNAINAPIQGSSADMIKIAMIRIHEAIRKEKMSSRMVLQVHDELVFDALRSEVDHLTNLVERHMKEAMELSVPVLVDVKTGENWLEAH
jgi:DNA polymerase-1